MKKLTILLTLALMAVPAFAHTTSHSGSKSNRTLGLEILQDLESIPQQRMRKSSLPCR